MEFDGAAIVENYPISYDIDIALPIKLDNTAIQRWNYFHSTVKKNRKFTTIHWKICFRLAVVNLQQNVEGFLYFTITFPAKSRRKFILRHFS